MPLTVMLSRAAKFLVDEPPLAGRDPDVKQTNEKREDAEHLRSRDRHRDQKYQRCGEHQQARPRPLRQPLAEALQLLSRLVRQTTR